MPLEENRRRGDELVIDAIAIHVIQPPRNIPASGMNGAKFSGALHEHGLQAEKT